MSAELRTTRRTRALFQALSSDFLLREQFVTDPAGILSEYIDRKPVPPDAATAANQLLYAVVSNPAMLKWLRQQADAAGNGDTTSRSFATLFASAVTRHSDEAIIASLIRCGVSEGGMVAPALDLVKAAAMLVGGPRRLSGGTEFSPITETEFSPITETEVSPITETEFSPITETEVSLPQVGTEVSPGTETEFTPGTETEFTPGTETEVSLPQVGTEVSHGTRAPQKGLTSGAADQSTRGEFQVALRSLVAYATELRAMGALTETGFE